MRYRSKESGGGICLQIDADRVSRGVAANQSQESLDNQLRDLHVLATRFGLYDAADWLRATLEHRQQYERDFGEMPSWIHMEAIA
jgi:hypothetical protein